MNDACALHVANMDSMFYIEGLFLHEPVLQ